MVRRYTPADRLNGKVAIVTGGSSGIGKVTVKRFAELGAHVFVLSRNKAKTIPVLENIKAETGNDKIELIEVDFSSLQEVKNAAEEFLSRNLPLHILACNAGSAANHGATADGFEFSFGTNYLSHFLLTQLLLNKLKQSAPSRIVNVSSIASLLSHSIDYDAVLKPSPAGVNMDYYGVSKLAQAYSLHPGIITTDVWRNFPIIFRWTTYWPFSYLSGMISEEDGALTTLYCSTAPELADESSSGKYYDDCALGSPNPLIDDQTKVDELWQFSLQSVKDFF